MRGLGNFNFRGKKGELRLDCPCCSFPYLKDKILKKIAMKEAKEQVEARNDKTK